MSTKVFIGNLNFRTTQDDLVKLLSEAGQIVDVHLPTDRMTGQPRGFAFVEFSTEQEAKAAIDRFNGLELDGRDLRINEAEDRPQRKAGGGGSGGHRSFRSDGPPRGGGGGGGWDMPPRGGAGKNKGSRRGLRAKKRSL